MPALSAVYVFHLQTGLWSELVANLQTQISPNNIAKASTCEGYFLRVFRETYYQQQSAEVGCVQRSAFNSFCSMGIFLAVVH